MRAGARLQGSRPSGTLDCLEEDFSFFRGAQVGLRVGFGQKDWGASRFERASRRDVVWREPDRFARHNRGRVRERQVMAACIGEALNHDELTDPSASIHRSFP